MSFDQYIEDFGKSVIDSRTLWLSAIVPLLITFIPPLAPIIAANPIVASWLGGALMAALRLITKKPLNLPQLPTSKPAP